MTVELAIAPQDRTHLLVIGTSLKKSRPILAAYLQSLEWQVLPRNVQPFYCFIDDGLEPDAKELVEEFLKHHQGALKPSDSPPAQDFTDAHPVTHQWTDSAMQRVGANKDWILGFARYNRAEAVWLCDSDLICDPMTLTSLWSVPDLIVCAVYWTRWQKVPSEQDPVHAGPQVWQTHPYGLSGNGMEESELRKRLIDRQLVPVLGQGACTLIRQGALEKGVCFAPMPGNTGPGLMQGEDRHFCLRATQLHIRMVADGWPDIFHIYHRPEDEQLISEMLQRLSWEFHLDSEGNSFMGRQDHPVLGDLISLELCALEPVPVPGGPRHAPVQFVRGRLGGLVAGGRLHPELEQAVLEMARGEVRVVPVHFGLDSLYPPHRGQRKLIRVTLIDHKPHGFPPVVEQEIYRNDAGSWKDLINCPPELVENLREIHGG